MTLRTLRERVWRLLGVSLDADSGELFPAFWSAAEANRAVNDAYRTLVRTSGALELRQVVPMVAGTATYSLHTATGPVMRVTFDDYPLRSFDPTSFDRTDDYWRERTGQVSMYHVGRLSPQKIRVYPVPADSGLALDSSSEYGVITDTDAGGDGTELGTTVDVTIDGVGGTADSEYGVVTGVTSTAGNLEVWSKKIAPLLEYDTDEPELPSYALLGVAFGAAALLLDKRGEGGNAAKASAYRKMALESAEFLSGVVRQRTHEKAYVVGTRARGPVRWTTRTPWTGQDDNAPIPVP